MDNQDSYKRCPICNQLIPLDAYEEHQSVPHVSTPTLPGQEETIETDVTEDVQPTTGAPLGNDNAMKYKTPEDRQALCKKYCDYLRTGKPKEYFPECDIKTIGSYMKQFPLDFPSEFVEKAEREGKNNILNIGYAGMTGKIPGFKEKTWQFIIQNMTHWKLRTDVTSDDEKIEPIQIYKPEKLPEGS